MVLRAFSVRAVLATLVAALLVAACGASSPSAAPGQSGAPSGSGTPATGAPAGGAAPASAAATGEPDPTWRPGEEPRGTFNPTAVPDLEALLPDELGGAALEKWSYTGTDIMRAAGELEANQLVDWLKTLGKQPTDFAQAIADGPDRTFSVYAYRVAGAAAPEFLLSLTSYVGLDGFADTQEQATLGGKSVTTSIVNGERHYFYAKGDVLFRVDTADEAVAIEAFQKLP